MTDQAPELLPDIVERCRRYAVVIEGIIVVPDDWQPGEDHREVKEPRATLLEAADIIERLTRPTPAERPVAQVREALALAIKHIEHMAAFITEANCDYHCGTYSFESLGEDMPGIREALTARPSDAAVAWIDQNYQIDRYGVALMMIREGCADPSGLARRILAEFGALPPDEPARVTPSTVGGDQRGPDVPGLGRDYR